MHVTTKCLEENQQILRDDENGSREISNILAAVYIKEEVLDRSISFEGMTWTSALDQPQNDDVLDGAVTNDYEGQENKGDIPFARDPDECQEQDPEYIEVHGCLNEIDVGDHSMVKLEDSSYGAISDLSTNRQHIRRTSSANKKSKTKFVNQNALENNKLKPEQSKWL